MGSNREGKEAGLLVAAAEHGCKGKACAATRHKQLAALISMRRCTLALHSKDNGSRDTAQLPKLGAQSPARCLEGWPGRDPPPRSTPAPPPER